VFWVVQISYSGEVFGCLGANEQKNPRGKDWGGAYLGYDFLDRPLSEQVSHRHFEV